MLDEEALRVMWGDSEGRSDERVERDAKSLFRAYALVGAVLEESLRRKVSKESPL